MILKNKKGFTLIETIISLVCLSLLLVSVLLFVGGQNRFSLNLVENNKSYNEVCSYAEMNKYASANNIVSSEISFKIGVKTFKYTVPEVEYSDRNNKYFLYMLKIR